MPDSAGADRRLLAVACSLASMTSIQLGAAISERLFTRMSPAGIVAMRVLAAAIILSVLVRPRLADKSRHELGSVLLLGAITGGMMLCFFQAIARAPLGIVVSIEFLGPLTVALVGSRSTRDLLWAMCAATGIGLFALGSPISGSLDPVGLLFAVGAATGWGTYILLTQRVGSVFPGLQGVAVSLSVAAVVTLPFAVVSDGTRLLDPGTLPIVLALGVLVPALPFALEMIALRHLRAAAFGLLMSLEPALGALFGYLVAHQHLRPIGLVAIGLIVAASLGTTAGQLRREVIALPTAEAMTSPAKNAGA